MICKTCKDEGAESRVTPHGGSVTAMYFEPFYDEKGTYHHHDMNVHCGDYSCSRGHRWTEEFHRTCPGCNWPKGIDPPYDGEPA